MTIAVPSGQKSTASTKFAWPYRYPCSDSVAVSHTRAVPSTLAETICDPSGLMATSSTSPWFPDELVQLPPRTTVPHAREVIAPARDDPPAVGAELEARDLVVVANREQLPSACHVDDNGFLPGDERRVPTVRSGNDADGRRRRRRRSCARGRTRRCPTRRRHRFAR